MSVAQAKAMAHMMVVRMGHSSIPLVDDKRVNGIVGNCPFIGGPHRLSRRVISILRRPPNQPAISLRAKFEAKAVRHRLLPDRSRLLAGRAREEEALSAPKKRSGSK